jgi:glucan phosphoethanolaminetransferase (alkaline phosphatase superfamily)
LRGDVKTWDIIDYLPGMTIFAATCTMLVMGTALCFRFIVYVLREYDKIVFKKTALALLFLSLITLGVFTILWVTLFVAIGEFIVGPIAASTVATYYCIKERD